MSINNIQASKHLSFETGYSGFIGIQPYTFDETRKEENFMWQLKNQGLIDHLTVAFYSVSDDKDTENSKSIIRFGGMDKEGLKTMSTNSSKKVGLVNIKTRNKTTWDLNLTYMKLGSDKE